MKKSFPVIFRVAPPVLTDWRKFFDSKFRETFGESEEKELQHVRNNFRSSSKGNSLMNKFGRQELMTRLKSAPRVIGVKHREQIKRSHGQYYTSGNPFAHRAFWRWAKSADLPSNTILEPFAGANNLIWRLQEMGLCKKFESYDLAPAGAEVKKRNTLKNFPEGYDVCITNPPWLAKNSASVRELPFPECQYDDIYKLALEKCLVHCPWVAALVPESFIRAHLFQDRLQTFISLTSRMFKDTGHPVGLALFEPTSIKHTHVWSGHRKVGNLSELQELRPLPAPNGPLVRFNDPDGNVGLIALDNTQTASIRFCDIDELASYQVKKTGRHITKLLVDGRIQIKEWNHILEEFREATHDVLMTCYKGIRKDGRYRRRCDWGLARGIVHHAEAPS